MATTRTVQEQLDRIVQELQQHQTTLGDAYIAGELAKAEGDDRALQDAQKQIAQALAQMEPLRAKKSRLEEQLNAEQAARKRAQNQVRLSRFRSEIAPVLPDLMKRLETHHHRIMAHAKERLEILVEEEYLRSELAGRITPEISWVRQNFPDENPLRPRLADWGPMRLGMLPVTQIVKSPREIKGSIKWIQELAGTPAKENKNGHRNL